MGPAKEVHIQESVNVLATTVSFLAHTLMDMQKQFGVIEQERLNASWDHIQKLLLVADKHNVSHNSFSWPLP